MTIVLFRSASRLCFRTGRCLRRRLQEEVAKTVDDTLFMYCSLMWCYDCVIQISPSLLPCCLLYWNIDHINFIAVYCRKWLKDNALGEWRWHVHWFVKDRELKGNRFGRQTAGIDLRFNVSISALNTYYQLACGGISVLLGQAFCLGLSVADNCSTAMVYKNANKTRKFPENPLIEILWHGKKSRVQLTISALSEELRITHGGGTL